MQAKHATTILKLIGFMTINDLREQGALEAVLALQDFAARPDTIFIIVPISGGTTRKVEAIKTIRAAGKIGLKEAKDLFDEAWGTGTAVRRGTAVRIGPFNFGVNYDEVIRRLDGQVSVLEVEIG
jgi:ribosomal protein L7/L12